MKRHKRQQVVVTVAEQLWSDYLSAKSLRTAALAAYRTAQDAYFSAEEADAQASVDLLMAIAGGVQQAIDAAVLAKVQTTAALNSAGVIYAASKNNLTSSTAMVDAAYRALTQHR